MISKKRIYDPSTKDDGYRVLVDRLWPRGISKQKANIDLWMKDIAPSTELRKWFGHDSAKWTEFKKRYLVELEDKKDLINQIITKAKEGNVTLLYGAKDLEHNQAIILMTVLSKI